MDRELVKGIRGHFLVSHSNGMTELVDIGTPESDATMIQALRRLADSKDQGTPYMGVRLEYQSWIL